MGKLKIGKQFADMFLSFFVGSSFPTLCQSRWAYGICSVQFCLKLFNLYRSDVDAPFSCATCVATILDGESQCHRAFHIDELYRWFLACLYNAAHVSFVWQSSGCER